MRIFSLIILSLILSFTALAQEQDGLVTIRNINPDRPLHLTGKPLYLFGMIKGGDANLSVNGAEALTSEDGAYLVFADPVLSRRDEKTFAEFLFAVTYNDGRIEEQKVTVPAIPRLKTQPGDSLAFDGQYRPQPAGDIALLPGDPVTVEVKTAPGADVWFTIDSIDAKFPMAETPRITSYLKGDAVFGQGFSGLADTVCGIYKGTALIKDALEGAAVTIHAKADGRTITTTAEGTVTTLPEDRPLVMRTRYNPNRITARVGAGLGYYLFLHEGINLQLAGREGPWVKAKLADDYHIYMPANNVEMLPEGTPLPGASLYIVRTKEHEGRVDVSFGFSERVAHRIDQLVDPQRLVLTAFNVTSNMDWVFYDDEADDALIKEITWEQKMDGIFQATIYLNQKTHWGWKESYDGSTFILSVNKPARRNKGLFFANQLDGRTIVLDPGHEPDNGAVGPRGTKEKDVNMQITLRLKEMLEAEGAEVHLTHSGEGAELRERRALVNKYHPEISISIHNNAVPQGVDALEHHGSSVYYYYRQAKPLAQSIYQNFLDDLKLRDFGLYWDNLYMCRIPESVSLLVEPAFMIVPEQERLLNTEDFREKIARSILDGIEAFYEEYAE